MQNIIGLAALIAVAAFLVWSCFHEYLTHLPDT
jgi:hypothetical protein